MRILSTLALFVFASLPLHAADDAPAPPATLSADEQRVELGEGISLPRPVFEQLTARDDGLAMIERIQRQASEARTFDGVPHLMVIFVSVLLFFWSAMFYYQRKHARVHRTIQLMVEKGMAVPPELLRSDETPAAGSEGAVGPALAPPVWASNILWGGLLWVTIGITGMLYLGLRHSDAWPWGLAAVVYGIGAIATAFAKRTEKP
jgi:hypothetical protein